MNEPHDLDVALKLRDVDDFAAKASGSRAGPAEVPDIRSLTVFVGDPSPPPANPSIDLTLIKNLNYKQAMEEEGFAKIEWYLIRLAVILAAPRLSKLKCFSLRNIGTSGCDMSLIALAALIVALPASCVSLELDTGGMDNSNGFCGHTPPAVHLCVALRLIMPRMHHVRLRLRSVCPDLLISRKPHYWYQQRENRFSLPEMRTLLIKVEPLQPHQTHSNGCGAIEGKGGEDPWVTITHALEDLLNPDIPKEMDIFEWAEGDPQPDRIGPPARVRPDAKLSVLTTTGHDNDDRRKYETLIRADMHTKTSYAFPATSISFRPDAKLMRMPGKKEVIAPTWEMLHDAAEISEDRDTGWITTANKTRLPRQVADEWNVDVQEPPLVDSAKWREENPDKGCYVWINEGVAGQKLLDAEVRSGPDYLKRDPVIERTPPGWERPKEEAFSRLVPIEELVEAQPGVWRYRR